MDSLDPVTAGRDERGAVVEPVLRAVGRVQVEADGDAVLVAHLEGEVHLRNAALQEAVRRGLPPA